MLIRTLVLIYVTLLAASFFIDRGPTLLLHP